MVCFYFVYLLIMYFNPRIEAWLYKVTNTTSPEYKSELHAINGESKSYSVVPTDHKDDSAKEKTQSDQEDEKNDGEKRFPEDQKEERADDKEGRRGGDESTDDDRDEHDDADIKDSRGLNGK